MPVQGKLDVDDSLGHVQHPQSRFNTLVRRADFGEFFWMLCENSTVHLPREW